MKSSILKFVQIFVVSIVFFSCSATYLDYYRNVNEADYSLAHNNYEEAEKHYKEAFSKVVKWREEDILHYTECLLIKGDTILATNLLINPDNFIGMRIGKKQLGSLLDDVELDSVLQHIFSIKKSEKDSITSGELYILLSELKKKDQVLRQEFRNIVSMQDTDSLKLHQKTSEMIAHGEYCEILLDSIFAIHGYIGYQHPFLALKVHTLMLHSNTDWFKSKKRWLFQELKKGNILPEEYADLVDRKVYIEKGNEPYYYKWTSDERVPIIGPKVLFKRYNKIGLSPYFSNYGRFRIERPTYFFETFQESKSEFNCIK